MKLRFYDNINKYENVRYTLLAKKLCDSSFLGKNLDLIHPHFNMYWFRSYHFFCTLSSGMLAGVVCVLM